MTVIEPNHAGYITLAVPLFNLEPAQGEPARFGFEAVEVPVVLDTRVRTGGGLRRDVSVNNTTEAAQVLGAQVTFWGDPAATKPRYARGWACLLERRRKSTTAKACATARPPFETPVPDAADLLYRAALSTSMEGESWTRRSLGRRIRHSRTSLGEPLANAWKVVRQLPFSPAIEVAPEQQAEEGQPQQETSTASTPTGLKVDVKLAQQGTLDSQGAGGGRCAEARP